MLSYTFGLSYMPCISYCLACARVIPVLVLTCPCVIRVIRTLGILRVLRALRISYALFTISAFNFGSILDMKY